MNILAMKKLLVFIWFLDYLPMCVSESICKNCYPRVVLNITLTFEKWWYMGIGCLSVYSSFRPHLTVIMGIRKIVSVLFGMTFTLTYQLTKVHICIRFSFYNQNRIVCDLSKLVLWFQIANPEFCKNWWVSFWELW